MAKSLFPVLLAVEDIQDGRTSESSRKRHTRKGVQIAGMRFAWSSAQAPHCTCSP